MKEKRNRNDDDDDKDTRSATGMILGPQNDQVQLKESQDEAQRRQEDRVTVPGELLRQTKRPRTSQVSSKDKAESFEDASTIDKEDKSTAGLPRADEENQTKEAHAEKTPENMRNSSDNHQDVLSSMLYTDNIAAACAATNELVSQESQETSSRATTNMDVGSLLSHEKASMSAGLFLRAESTNAMLQLQQKNIELTQENLLLRQEVQQMSDLLTLLLSSPKFRLPGLPPVDQQHSLPAPAGGSSIGTAGRGLNIPDNLAMVLTQRYQEQQRRPSGTIAVNTPEKHTFLNHILAACLAANQTTNSTNDQAKTKKQSETLEDDSDRSKSTGSKD